MSRPLRPYLEYQADRVEAVLAAHRAPGRVTGGTVGPRLIRFFLNPAPHIRFASVKRLADDLALALRVSNLRIDRGKEGVVLEFSNPDPRPVDFLTLLPEVMPLPVSTALLGQTDDGSPLLVRLASPEVAHILIAGTTGSGKSALLRAMAASLVLGHRPDVLRLLCIDPKDRTFRVMGNLPHLSRPPIASMSEALEALCSLMRVMEVRDRRGETPDAEPGGRVPRIVVLIDELADLVMQGAAPVSDALTRLLQRGREAGIHLIAATQRPSSAILSGLMRANFPLRLVGRVVSADDARVASGRAGTNAHLLDGRGDFLAVSGGDSVIRFQVAYIAEKEFRRQMAEFGTAWLASRQPDLTRHVLPAPASARELDKVGR